MIRIMSVYRNYMQCIILLCFIIAQFFFAGALHASEPVKFTLKYEEIDLTKFTAFMAPQMLLKKQINFKEQPEYISKNPLYLSCNMKELNPINMVLDETKGSGQGYNVIYVDMNSDNIITENEKINFIDIEKAKDPKFMDLIYSEPIRIEINLANNLKFPYIFRVYFVSRMRSYGIMSKTYYTGEMNIDGNKTKTAVVFDPSFLASEKSLNNIKIIYVDMNKDGIFSMDEVCPYGQELIIGKNVVSFDIKGFSDDYKSISCEAATIEAKYGTISSPHYKDFTVYFKNKGQMAGISGENNKCTIPAGEYRLMFYTPEKKDSIGNLWKMQIMWKKSQTISIEENKTTEIVNISPITAKLSASKKNSCVTFSIIWNAGESLASIVLFKNKNEAVIPKVKVLNDKNEVIYTGNFKYG